MPKQTSSDLELFLKKMKKIFPSIFSETGVPESMLPLFIAQFLEQAFEIQVSRDLTLPLRKTLPKEFQDYSKSINKILTIVYPNSQEEQTKEVCAKAVKRIMKSDQLEIEVAYRLFLKHFIKEILTALEQITSEKDASVLMTLMCQVFKFFGESKQNRSLPNEILILLRGLNGMSRLKDISYQCRQFLASFQDKFLETVLPFDKLTTLSKQQKVVLSESMIKSDDFLSYYLTVILYLARDKHSYDIEKLNQVVSEQLSLLRIEISKSRNDIDEVFQIYASRLQMVQKLLHQFLKPKPDIFNGEESVHTLREIIRSFNKLLSVFRERDCCEVVLFFNPVIYADSDLLAMPKPDKKLFAAIKKEYREQCKQFQPALYNTSAKALPLTAKEAKVERKSKKSKKAKKAKAEQTNQLVENPADAGEANFIADVLEPDNISLEEQNSISLNEVEVPTARQQLTDILDRLESFNANLAASLMNVNYPDPFVYVKAEFLAIYNGFFPIAHALRNDAASKDLLTLCFSNLIIIRYKLLINREDDILEQLNLPSDCNVDYDYSTQQPINFIPPLQFMEIEKGAASPPASEKKPSSSGTTFERLKKHLTPQQPSIPSAQKAPQAFFLPVKGNVPSIPVDQQKKSATKSPSFNK